MKDNLEALNYVASSSHRAQISLTDIARESQNDSTTIKVLTVIATIYLPASLLAVSLPIINVINS
jgi:Mg2+ and Co2+ transporter CorA